MICANLSKQPKIMQQNYKNMNPQEDHLVDTKCHSIDCSLKFKRKSMKTVDDKSAKCLMSIYQIGQRADNRTTKIWTLKQKNHSVDMKCQCFGYSWKIQRKSTKTVDDESAKCFMSIYQNSRRSCYRTTKIWALKYEDNSVDTKCHNLG